MTVRTGFLAAAWRLARNSFASELESSKFAIRVRASSICANALCQPSLRSVSNDWAPNDIAWLHNRSSNVTGLAMRLRIANSPAAHRRLCCSAMTRTPWRQPRRNAASCCGAGWRTRIQRFRTNSGTIPDRRLSMSKRLMLSCLATAAIAFAQYTPPPLSYTLVQQNSLFGPATTTSVYRNDSKAAIDIVQPGTHIRTVYDLQAHTNIDRKS